jgi:hypothetical protein
LQTHTDPEVAAIHQLLDIAWSGDRQAPEAARQVYMSGRDQAKNRPRWEYAYGIACLKMKRYPAAAPAFSAAALEAGSFDFAAWKGLLWTEFTLKKYPDGLGHVESLAKLVAAPAFAGEPDERDRIAVWVGQTMAALEKIVTQPKALDQIAQTDAKLRQLWPAELAEAYQSGRDYTDLQYDELMSGLKQAKDAAQSKEEEARTQKLQRLQKNVDQAGKERENLKKSAEELQKKAQDRLLQIDKQLARLERDYEYLQARAMSVMRSMAILQAQMQRVQVNQGNRSNAQAPVTGSLNTNLGQLDFMLGAYQREAEMTTFRAAMIADQAMRGLETRQQLAQQVQSTIGELGTKEAELEKWQGRQNKAGERLKQSKVKATSASVRQKRSQAKSLNTYLEFDVDWERIRLTEPPDAPE